MNSQLMPKAACCGASGTSYFVPIGFVDWVVTASITSFIPLLDLRACP